MSVRTCRDCNRRNKARAFARLLPDIKTAGGFIENKDGLAADIRAGDLGEGQARVQACFSDRPRLNVDTWRAPYRLGLDSASLTQVIGLG